MAYTLARWGEVKGKPPAKKKKKDNKSPKKDSNSKGS